MTKVLTCLTIPTLLFFLCFPREVMAKIYLGLNVGAEAGSWAAQETLIDSPTGNQLDMNPAGFVYGYAYSARLCASWKVLMLGAEYYRSTTAWTYLPDPDSSDDDRYQQAQANKASTYLLMGFLGLNERWSIWLGYSLKTSLKFKININPDEAPTAYEGKSYKVGLGIRPGRRNIWVNMEYVINSYDKVTRDGLTSKMPGTIGNHTYRTLDQGVIVFTITFMLGKFKGVSSGSSSSSGSSGSSGSSSYASPGAPR